jgi:hypothetical protein
MTLVDTSSGNQFARVSLELPLRPRATWWVTAVIAPSIDHAAEEIFMGPPARYAAKPLPTGDSIYVSAYSRPRRCRVIIY